MSGWTFTPSIKGVRVVRVSLLRVTKLAEQGKLKPKIQNRTMGLALAMRRVNGMFALSK